MKTIKIIAAIILLIVSFILLFDKLFTPQPIQIVLDSGQQVVTQNTDYFTLTETIMLIVCSFFIGSAAMYLYHNADNPIFKQLHKEPDKHKLILPLLKEEERKVIEALKSVGGNMLQNKLVQKLNISKVKVTRVLSKLERKNLIMKERYGLTNNIKLL